MSQNNESYSFDCTDENLAASIVEAVATVTDRDPLALASLYDVVDAESLETLVRGTDDVQVTFTYEGVSVTVTGDDEIVVADPTSNDPVADALDGASAVLVVEESRADDTCRALLSGDGRPRSLLGMTFAGSVHDRLAIWDPLGADPARDATVISMGAIARSTSADGGGPSLPLTIEAIEDPADITALEVAIHEQLGDWDGDATQTVACFHSITDLLDHVDERTARRYVDTLARRFADADATAHFHLDRRAHDETTTDRFRDCFDAVVTVQADGTRSVETR